jgi:hypothetical protein
VLGFGRGWERDEWRWQTRRFAPSKRSFPAPLWLGKEHLAGKFMLLHAEPGLREAMQFGSYVLDVAARGASVILAILAPLKELLSRLPGVAHVVDDDDALPPIDFHCPLTLRLCYARRNHPGSGPLSHPRSRSRRAMARAAGEARRTENRIGWAGKPGAGRVSERRSMPLERKLGLSAVLRVTWCLCRSKRQPSKLGVPAGQCDGPRYGRAPRFCRCSPIAE